MFEVFEQSHQQVLPVAQFLKRLGNHAALAVAILLGSLLLGMIGYVSLEGLSWPDAFLNAAMLLGGMGPVSPIRSLGGKLFAGVYALYSGMVFLGVAGIVVAPIIHRALHKLHAGKAAGTVHH